MKQKNVKLSGADERTPSKSQYFSWINHTNEGATEEHTLTNLAFFRYLKETYGMQLDIYAWDAGNLDGAGELYETLDGEKLTAQYPDGYGKVVKAAADIGTRMGVWGGADGYGNTPEEAQKRRDLLVSLCRDYHFALFKFDAVCGPLREEKRGEFAKSMQECREYSPDLILLNHRNDLGEEEVYATTFLWEGQETYVDVHGYNTVTAPHNRAYTFFRGHTPELKRLTEDHGVCISASVDYFEDDLVYQAFNRSLILAPEIYGNPWFMRDDELPTLARIYNLHRRHRDILIDGMFPKTDLGNNAVFRGDTRRRFLATGNAAWEKKEVSFLLNEEIGLAPCKRVCVTRRFPTEKFLGVYAYGDTVKVELAPFRATLVEICDAEIADTQIVDCEYTVLHEAEGKIDKINVLKTEGNARLYSPATDTYAPLTGVKGNTIDIAEQYPQLMGSLQSYQADNAEQIYETAYFGADNDSLEYRSVLRSGKTEIPEVEAARKAFFAQKSYRLRGLDPRSPFDGDRESIFDTKSRAYFNFDDRKGYRVKEGCLRVDCGAIINADRIEIEYFDAEQNPESIFDPQIPTEKGSISSELSVWTEAPLERVENIEKAENTYFAYYVDVPMTTTGWRKKAVYQTVAPFRYFRLPAPVDRIYSIRFFKGEGEIKPVNPKLTNLFAAYEQMQTKAAAKGTFTLPNDDRQYPYLAVAFEGETGHEAACCCAEIDGELIAFPLRAPAFPANVYEYPVHPVKGYYTFFLPVRPEWKGKEIAVHALFAQTQVPVDVYLCDGHGKREGLIAEIKDKE